MILPLIVSSLLAWVILIERVLKYRKLGNGLREFHLEAMNFLLKKDVRGLTQLCEKNPELPTAEIIYTALSKLQSDQPKHWKEATERKRQLVNAEMKKYLWVLGTIGSSAPFIGLAGTVIGILKSFHEMALKGSGGFTVVAAGISEALIATAGGIVVAVFSVVVYNIFQTRWSKLVLTVRLQTEEFVEQMETVFEEISLSKGKN